MYLPECILKVPDYLSLPRKEIVTVQFGDIFIDSFVNPPRPDKLRTRIITSLDEHGSFGANTIINPSPGEEMISPMCGTVYISDIIEILDHWDVQRVTQAFINGCRYIHMEATENQLKILRQESAKSPFCRKINILKQK